MHQNMCVPAARMAQRGRKESLSLSLFPSPLPTLKTCLPPPLQLPILGFWPLRTIWSPSLALPLPLPVALVYCSLGVGPTI